MKFCWFTSFIGYPNFLKKTGNSHELGEAFITFAKASIDGKSYTEAKSFFPDLDPAQVETKKAAFQEYGFLYVTPRSDTITLTPLGKQLYSLLSDKPGREKNRRAILLILSHALTRYQFNNPLPVGGNRQITRAQSTDVLPYLACCYLLLKLDGVLTVSELRGAVFGLKQMAGLRQLEERIRKHRQNGTSFPELSGLPTNKRTAENLKIYFMSHLSLDGEILKTTKANYYGVEEQAFELTQFGYELVESAINKQWAGWRNTLSTLPVAINYPDLQTYFKNGVGAECPQIEIKADAHKAEINTAKISGGLLDVEDVENLRQLPRRKFQEGRKRLILHARTERIRNLALIRESKRLFKKKHGKLYCEVCSFDFERKYGQRGKDYIEAHHKTPISVLEDVVDCTVDDLTLVCSNCHRMLHRQPWITSDELQKVIHIQKVGSHENTKK